MFLIFQSQLMTIPASHAHDLTSSTYQQSAIALTIARLSSLSNDGKYNNQPQGLHTYLVMVIDLDITDIIASNLSFHSSNGPHSTIPLASNVQII